MRNMKNMNADQERKCHMIIHAFSICAGGVGGGLAQLPLSDRFVIGPLQMAMVIALGHVFGLEFTRYAGAATTTASIGMQLGRTASQIAVGWIPVVGNITNAGTAAALTEAFGWWVAEDFAKKASPEKKVA